MQSEFVMLKLGEKSDFNVNRYSSSLVECTSSHTNCMSHCYGKAQHLVFVINKFLYFSSSLYTFHITMSR